MPLHYYIMRGDIAAMRAVLESGADVDPTGVLWSPLEEAATRSIDTVLLLLTGVWRGCGGTVSQRGETGGV
jgi:ankyrin repeat protein